MLCAQGLRELAPPSFRLTFPSVKISSGSNDAFPHSSFLIEHSHESPNTMRA
jgi:hypothetical protein